jgi:hypothetical protein
MLVGGDEYTARVDAALRQPPRRLESSKLGPYEAAPGERPPVPITFGYVFVNYGDEAWGLLVQGFRLALATLYPDCRVATIDLDVDKDFVPMVGTQVLAKLRRSFRGNMAFLDPDVIAYRRCDPFDADFDVGLTDSRETWPIMPFNAGVQFYKDTPGAQKYLDTVMEIAHDIPQGVYPWFTNQMAMRLAYEMLRGEVKFKIFPHALYNFVPDIVQPTDAYFVHLKGQRKSMVREYLRPVLENKLGR